MSSNVIFHWFAPVLAACILAAAGGICPLAASEEAAQEWILAGSNRRAAADLRIEEAGTLLQSGQALRQRDYFFEGERKRNLSRAGQLEMRAGDLLVAAVANLDKAAKHFQTASVAFTDAGKAQDGEQCSAHAAACAAEAASLCAQVAGAYAGAAEAFAPHNGDLPDDSEAAAEKQAQWQAEAESRQ